MLSSLLGQLQNYFSKYFVVGSFSPMLAFVFVNGAVAYIVYEPWQSWVHDNLFGTGVAGSAFMVSSICIAIVLAAYVLSSLNNFLRQQLEGKWWGFLARRFIPAQNRRRLKILDELNDAFKEMADFDSFPEVEAKLLEARRRGTQDASGQEFKSWPEDKIKLDLEVLEEKRRAHTLILAEDLKTVADRLQQRLMQFDADAGDPHVVRVLDGQHRRLSGLIEYATDFYAKEGMRGRQTRLRNELNSNFGSQEIAPTKMGNIANTIQSYVLRRYNCNLEVVWSNLIQIVQANDKAYATLMETKTQLDFLVSCCWLTLLTCLIWCIVTLAIVPDRGGFLLAALGGPFASYLWYRAAAEQYRSFADVTMTLFDTFRFDLLQKMRLQNPADVEQERFMWGAIDRLMTFGDEENFRYEKAGASS